jgi:hypothetical protein
MGTLGVPPWGLWDPRAALGPQRPSRGWLAQPVALSVAPFVSGKTFPFSFSRNVPMAGVVLAGFRPKWPVLVLTVAGFNFCVRGNLFFGRTLYPRSRG